MSTFTVELPATGARFTARADEPVLAAAEAAGIALAHDCRSGACATCRARVVEGTVEYVDFPMGLTDEEAAEGFALLCQARAASDLVIDIDAGAPPCSAPARHVARVTSVSPLAADIVRLALELVDPPGDFVFRPGQYLNVCLPDGERRSFSMASAPDGGRIDCHVRRIPGGRFTTALAALEPGATLDLELPIGRFRSHPEAYRPMLMIATGTGIAPIRAMLDALCGDPDCPPVHLYWGMRTAGELYLADEPARWRERLFEFQYTPVLSRAGADWQGRRGHVQDAVLADYPDLSEFSIHLCGSPAMIDDARARFVAHGASVAHLHSDSFLFQHQLAPVRGDNDR